MRDKLPQRHRGRAARLARFAGLVGLLLVPVSHAQPPPSGVAAPNPQQLQQAHRYAQQFQQMQQWPRWNPYHFTTPPMAIPEAYTRPSQRQSQSSGEGTAWPQPYYDFCNRFPMARECRGYLGYPGGYPGYLYYAPTINVEGDE